MGVVVEQELEQSSPIVGIVAGFPSCPVSTLAWSLNFTTVSFTSEGLSCAFALFGIHGKDARWGS